MAFRQPQQRTWKERAVPGPSRRYRGSRAVFESREGRRRVDFGVASESSHEGCLGLFGEPWRRKSVAVLAGYYPKTLPIPWPNASKGQHALEKLKSQLLQRLAS